MVRYSELRPGMVVLFNNVDLERWQTNLGDLILDPQVTPQIWYDRYYRQYEGVPLKFIRKEKVSRPRHTGNPNKYERLVFETTNGKEVYIPEFYFNPNDNDAFKDTIFKARDVRNTRLMAARMGLPHGPESIIASQLSGLPGNAAQQNDDITKKAGIQGPAPDRRGFNGGKTRKGRKSKKTRRTRKN